MLCLRSIQRELIGNGKRIAQIKILFKIELIVMVCLDVKPWVSMLPGELRLRGWSCNGFWPLRTDEREMKERSTRPIGLMMR